MRRQLLIEQDEVPSDDPISHYQVQDSRPHEMTSQPGLYLDGQGDQDLLPFQHDDLATRQQVLARNFLDQDQDQDLHYKNHPQTLHYQIFESFWKGYQVHDNYVLTDKLCKHQFKYQTFHLHD